MFEACKRLAFDLDHVDMMSHVFCKLGYPVGLDRAAKGMSLVGKPEGMSGALAPRLWAEGKRREVLDYVAQDVRITLELAQTCEGRGYLLDVESLAAWQVYWLDGAVKAPPEL